MKKNMIAVLLSIVMAVGSVGGSSVFAAETTAQEAGEIAQEEAEEELEEVPEENEDADNGASAEDIAEEESAQVVEEPAQEDEEPVADELNGDEQDLTEDDTVDPDTEDVEADENDNSTEMSDSTSETEEDFVVEEEIVTTEENEALDDTATSGTCGENSTWVLNGDTLTISGTGGTYDYISSGSYAPWYGLREQIKTIVISVGITRIGRENFQDCINLKNVVIQEGLTSIGPLVFHRCTSLEKIEIPNSVTEIEASCFAYCTALKDVKLPEHLTVLSACLFCSCTSIENIALPDSITVIEDATFQSCFSLSEITIPNGVTSIGHQAFQTCSSLAKVEIPTTVKSIGKAAFESCASLAEVKIPEGVTIIESEAFNDCTSLKHVDLPDGLTIIGYTAFLNCISLENLTIPDTVTEIDGYAFYGCKSLTDIRIPSNVTVLGYKSFLQCESLINIEILGGLSTMAYGVIYDCKNLKKVIIRDDITSIDTHTFTYCPNVIVYTAGKNVLDFCKTRNIKCCPYIEEVYPEPYTEDLDNKSSNLVFYADFMRNIKYNDGFAYLFEVGNDTAPVEEIFLGEPDEGKCSIENGKRLILHFSRDSLKRGESYYIRIEENALKLLDDGGEELDVSYPGIADNVWTFSTKDLFTPDEPSSIQNKEFHFRSSLKNDDSISYTFDFNDDWVFSSSKDDHYELMKTSIRIAMAAYGAKEKIDDNELIWYSPVNIQEMMHTMRFDYTESSVNYPEPTKENENTIGSAIGMKNLKMPDGSTRSIILVAVRGGGYGAEWGGNFHIGISSKNSYGFELAAQQIAGRLNTFFENYKQYISDDLRIWITGYSRGGATSNLVAAGLINGTYKLSGVSPDEVMAFCFECPNTTTDPDTYDSKYSNIINIVNLTDFVPFVPMRSWGFGRYGDTYYLPCAETTSNYTEKYYEPMCEQYKRIFDKNSITYNDDVFVDRPGQYSILDDYFNYIGFSIDRSRYSSEFESSVVDIAGSTLGGQGSPNWESAAPRIVDLLDIAKGRYKRSLNFLGLFIVGKPAPAPNAHYPEKCLSWIDSFNSFDEQNLLLYRKAIINCPVDVTVRDDRGNVVGKIENDEVEEIENGIVARIDEDGQKVFYLPQDEEYTINIKATDDGEVNYTVEEYNIETQTVEKVVNYKSIEVSTGDELLGTATEIPEDDEAEYTLQRAEESALITPDDVLTGDEINEYAVETVSGENGTVTGGGPYVKGEFARVTAVPEEGYVFDGWYSGDKCVSKEAEYRFAVEADTVLNAAFVAVADSISIENAAVSGIGEKTYTGTEVVQSITVKLNETVLLEGSDYTVSYENNINPGTATITISGVGDYTGTITKTFMILPGKTTRGDMFNLANNVKVTWKEVPGAKYYKVYREGITDKKETQKEPVIVTERLIGWDSKPGLTNGHAYRYKIVASLTGKGDSSGDSTLSYSKVMYRLKTVVIRSVNNTAPSKVTVRYDKTTSGDSYVLQYCERQDMVGAKTKVVLGANNTSYVIGGLKKGKTYYISIRVRKKVNGIDYYTTFGVPKKVTVTK